MNHTYTYDAEHFKSVFERSFTWISGFLRNVRQYPGKRAMIDPLTEKIWTYGELNRDVNRLANALHAHGVGQSDLVFYQLHNSPEFVFCYIAPQKLGAVNNPVNFNLSAGETANLLNRDKPRAYLYDCDIKETAWKALELCETPPEIIVAVDYQGTRPNLPAGHVFFDDFVSAGSTEEPDTGYVPDMYAEVTRLCTSGTTGTPKGVPLNNVNEVLSAHDTIMHYPLTQQDVTLNMAPWFHRGGLHSGGITPTFYVGAALVILRMFNAKACFDYTQKYGVTYLVGVPSALNNLAARQEKHPTDLSKLKGIVTMGSPLEKADCIRYQKILTPNIYNAYGTTETFLNTFLSPWDLPEMAGTIGQPNIGDEVRVVCMYDDRKAEPEDVVPRDGKTQGEIIAYSCGKSSLSYINNEAQTKEKYYKGWLYTKDIGTWDEGSFVSIAGRKDDMIICMGENIYPAQLEEVINCHPKVRDCMVTGVPDPSRGESVVAYIIPEGPDLTVKEINGYCVNHNSISTYMCPRYYAFVSELPYNSTGKKQHVVLKELAKQDLTDGRLLRP